MVMLSCKFTISIEIGTFSEKELGTSCKSTSLFTGECVNDYSNRLSGFHTADLFKPHYSIADLKSALAFELFNDLCRSGEIVISAAP